MIWELVAQNLVSAEKPLRYWFSPHVVKNPVSVVKLGEILVLDTLKTCGQNLVSVEKLVEIPVLATLKICGQNLVSVRTLVEISVLDTRGQNVVSAVKTVEMFLLALFLRPVSNFCGQKHRLSGKTR